MGTDSRLPGTYRVADGTRIEFSQALLAWIPLAYDELIATARRYNSVVTYKELAESVQEASGIRTRSLLTNWIGNLLEQVAMRAKAELEPPITSLCVHQDGTIGPGYAHAPKSVDDDVLEDIELYAARHRLLCYQKYAEDLPPDGGQPTLTKTVAERRARSLPKVEKPVVTCPVHNIAVPPSGVCDYCG